MRVVYTISIVLYGFAIRIASIIHRKANLWVVGRADWYRRLSERIAELTWNDQTKVVWFHCASLGEFEQGRPVIEGFRSKFPHYKIVLTFFSPSGYEIRKGYDGADLITYLPLDTTSNAVKFVDLIKPDLVFFVKYDYWFNLLSVLKRKEIPTYFISAIFRSDQHFFTWYGGWFRKMLNCVSWFFVQDDRSAKLLKQIGIEAYTISGDTRFDRVDAVAKNVKSFPLIEQFIGNTPVLLGGSTWSPDEEILFEIMKHYKGRFKFILAPHEIDSKRIDSLLTGLPIKGVRYSKITTTDSSDADVLIIDSIGILSNLYQYAYIAYIGGGFGAGIHNTLEAATFGIPIIFGPRYQTFREAIDLLSLGGAKSIANKEQALEAMNLWMQSNQVHQQASTRCKEYVQSNCGATHVILSSING